LPQATDIPNGYVLSNISGAPAVAAGNTLTATIDVAIGSTPGMVLARGASAWVEETPSTVLDIIGATPGEILVRGSSTWQQESLSTLLDSAIGSSPGSLIYRGSSTWTALTPGTAGELLMSGGASAPVWEQSAAGFGGLVVIAPNNGSTDAYTALAALAALNVPLFFPAGTYAVDAGSVTFTEPVTFAAGAVIKPATGKTITFEKGVFAPITQIFSNATAGLGSIVFSESSMVVGYAEWWGATPNNAAFDCQPAIQAALTSQLPVVQLLAGAYYITATVSGTVSPGANLWMNINGQKLRGVGASQIPAATSATGGPGNAAIDPNTTQLVMTSPSATGIQIGSSSATQPAQFLYAAWPEDLTLVRATASVPLGVSGASPIDNPASGVTGGPCGVEMRWCALCYPTRVISLEHTRAWSFFGTIENFITACSGLRYTAGQNSGNDNATGFFMDNSAPLGANSGNASLYFDHCRFFSNVSESGAPSYTYTAGIQSYQGFTDTYIESFESGLSDYGIDLNGVSTTALDFETEDLLIISGSLDSNAVSGIRIRTGSSRTAITIKGLEIAANTNAACVTLGGSSGTALNGSVSISDCQFVSGVNNPTGVTAAYVTGLSLTSNIHTRLVNPVVLSNCANFRVMDTINPAEAVIPAAAVLLTACGRGYVAPNIETPGGGTYVYGVNLSGSSNAKIEVNVTTINPAAVTTDVLIANGTPVASTGPFTYGVVSGVF
jgi:hypothetical protein